jgi:hypothetical protein
MTSLFNNLTMKQCLQKHQWQKGYTLVYNGFTIFAENFVEKDFVKKWTKFADSITPNGSLHII